MEILLQILNGIHQALCVITKKDMVKFCKLLSPSKCKILDLPGPVSDPSKQKKFLFVSHLLVTVESFKRSHRNVFFAIMERV